MFWMPRPHTIAAVTTHSLTRRQTDSGRERQKRTDERWKTTVWRHRMRRRKMANAICIPCNLAILASCILYGCVRVDKRPYLTSYECIVSACKLILSNLIRMISNYGLLMRQYRVYIEHTSPHNVTPKICDAENLQQQQLGEWAAVLWQHLFPFMHTHKLPGTRVWVFKMTLYRRSQQNVQFKPLLCIRSCGLCALWCLLGNGDGVSEIVVAGVS